MIESIVIEKYSQLGYDYKTITDLLQFYHGITTSVHTLKRRLQSNNLVKMKVNVDEDLTLKVPKEMASFSKLVTMNQQTTYDIPSERYFLKYAMNHTKRNRGGHRLDRQVPKMKK